MRYSGDMRRDELPEMLARVRHDSVLTASVRGKSQKGPGLWRVWLARLAPRRAQGYAGAALAAVMTGIVINALTLQHERHPSPFFADMPQSTVPVLAAKAPAPTPPTPAALNSSTTTVTPPVRPAELGGATTVTKAPDAIGEILKGGANRDAQHLNVTALTALAKLGYAVKPGSSTSETAAAIREFEKSHGLPISTEITPHLVKLLTVAANSSAAR